MKSSEKASEFIIVAGRLGSGKTSLIEALLEGGDFSATTAVIVNEVGAVNIDGAVLSESARGVALATLSNGCVCCSLTDDLVLTVEELVADRAERRLPPFQRIVLECSGLSKPGQVLGPLAQLSQLGLRVRVLTTYDCSLPPLDDDDFDAASAQLTAAQTIVLTKVDQVNAERRALAEERARAISPLADVVNEYSRTVRARTAFREVDASAPLPMASHCEVQMERRALLHPRVRVFRARFTSAPEWEQVLDWLENIAGALGERLLRMKSIVLGPMGNDRILLQSVGTTFSAPRRLVGTDGHELSAVFIVRDCGMQDLENVPRECALHWTAL